MTTYCLDSIFDPNANTREVFFGSKDSKRSLPIRTQPLSTRTQSDQGFTNRCTIYATAELVENKVYAVTGRWFEFNNDLIEEIWQEMKHAGLANDNWGAYINAPLKILLDRPITLRDKVSGDTITIKIDNWFYIQKRFGKPEETIEAIKREIAYGHGVLTGVHTTRMRLDYFGAKEKPYIVKEKKDPQEIAHAIVLSSYDNDLRPELVDSSGTWGDSIFDKGVCYFQDKHLPILMSMIGFTIDIVKDS